MLALFELPPNFTIEQLKASYKRLVLKYHPDRSMKVSDTPIFQMLTDCYRVLIDDLNARVSQREFYELRAHFKATNQQNQPTKPTPPSKLGSKFDAKLFNKLFEEHKIKDVHEEGYEDWSKSAASFKEKSKHAVVIYKEPQPIVSNADDIGCYEYGVKRVTDHSAQNQGHLQYMDYRLAHTTEKIIDTNRVKARKEYRSVQELEQDRSKISHTMTPSELAELMRHKAMLEKKEAERINRQKQYDDLIAKQFMRINNTLTFKNLTA